MLVGRIARLLNGKATDLKTNYVALGASSVAFAILAVLLQTLDRTRSRRLTAPRNRCCGRGKSMCIPHQPYGKHAEEKSKLRKELFATGAEVKVLNAATPDIPKSAFRPNTAANALVTVSPDGHPVSAKIVKSSGSPGMDHAVVNAAMASTYSPAMNNCKLVTGRISSRRRLDRCRHAPAESPTREIDGVAAQLNVKRLPIVRCKANERVIPTDPIRLTDPLSSIESPSAKRQCFLRAHEKQIRRHG